jgi:hypothetical protein
MADPHRDIAEEIDALSRRYRDGEFSETVFRASLKTRLPPDEIDHLTRQINERIREIHRGAC